MKTISFIFITLISLSFLYTACDMHDKDEYSLKDDVLFAVKNISACKTDLKTGTKEDSAEKINFAYSADNKTLRLTHVNAIFNCCTEEITADVNIIGNIIEITEIEKNGNCKCICPYDLDIEIYELKEKEYKVFIVSPYAPDKEKIEFSIDLTSNASGEHIVNYPNTEPSDCRPINQHYQDSSKLFEPHHLPNDDFVIEKIEVNGSCVEITVSHSGGCAEHEFELWQIHSISSSEAPYLYLSHNANGDMCEAWLTETISFDLTTQIGAGDSIYVPKIHKYTDWLTTDSHGDPIVNNPNTEPADCRPINQTYQDSSKLFEPHHLPKDDFVIEQIDVNGSCVEITVSYGGGCAEHEFELWQIHSISSSEAPYLYLSHNANGDVCKAWFTETIRFDLTSQVSTGDSIYIPKIHKYTDWLTENSSDE